MRYIDKSKPCAEFDLFLMDFEHRLGGNWEKIKKVSRKDKTGTRTNTGRNVLLILFKHLRLEQKGLCVYCQQFIPEKTGDNAEIYNHAHFEHVKKQALHKGLIFRQNNLSISCNGFDNDIWVLNDNAKIKEFCGHFKDGNYNATTFNLDLFLNPFEISDIENYFDYEFSDDNTEIFIVPNTQLTIAAQRQAQFMIDLLGLQHQTLCEMRWRQYEIIQEQISEGNDANDLLSEDFEELPAFYSMLKSKFL